MKKTTLTILLCTFLATVIFAMSACETQQSGDGTPTGTSASIETTTQDVTDATTAPTVEVTTAETTAIPDDLYADIVIPKFPFDVYLTPSDEQCVKQAVVAWKATYKEEIPWRTDGLAGVISYGVHSGVAIFFKGTDTAVKTEIKVGDVSYWYNYEFEMIACKDGTFYSLEEAYEQALVNEEDLYFILFAHQSVTSSLLSSEFRKLPESEYVTLDETVVSEILEAHAEFYKHNETRSLRCVAVYDDVYVLYIDGAYFADAVTYKWVNGYVFCYSSSQTLTVYCDGAFYQMQEAFDEGLLTDAQIAELQKLYTRIPKF